jgi:hypothetical protein
MLTIGRTTITRSRTPDRSRLFGARIVGNSNGRAYSAQSALYASTRTMPSPREIACRNSGPYFDRGEVREEGEVEGADAY